MSFKIGDIVVCIDVDDDLIINNTYIIIECTTDFVKVYDCEGWFECYKFELLSEVRKEKLKQLRNGI